MLYRTATGLAAAADVCVHRGARLSLGGIKDGVIACAYHGDRYDGAGRYTLTPARPGGPIPERLALRTFAVMARHGLIWVRLAEPAGAPSAPPDFAEHGAPGFQVITVPPVEWSASAGRQI